MISEKNSKQHICLLIYEPLLIINTKTALLTNDDSRYLDHIYEEKGLENKISFGIKVKKRYVMILDYLTSAFRIQLNKCVNCH